MKTITFRSGEFVANAQYLFNNKRHQLLQSPDGWISFYAVDDSSSVLAFISLHIENDLAVSPKSAPFGSLEFVDNLSPKIVYDFIGFVIDELKKKGIKKILLKNPPTLYNQAQQSLLTAFLLNHGFEITLAEISSLFTLSETDFTSHLHDWEKRKLRQAGMEGFSCKELDVHHLQTVYSFIEKCRMNKGYTLSMSLNQLQIVVNTFQDSFKLFVVTKKEELAAACIAIKVSETILYTFYYDHAEVFDQYSPTVLLIESIHAYCQQHAYRQLDLGTASLHTQPNFGLLDFKLHLGGTPTPKFTFEKILN